MTENQDASVLLPGLRNARLATFLVLDALLNVDVYVEQAGVRQLHQDVLALREVRKQSARLIGCCLEQVALLSDRIENAPTLESECEKAIERARGWHFDFKQLHSKLGLCAGLWPAASTYTFLKLLFPQDDVTQKRVDQLSVVPTASAGVYRMHPWLEMRLSSLPSRNVLQFPKTHVISPRHWVALVHELAHVMELSQRVPDRVLGSQAKVWKILSRVTRWVKELVCDYVALGLVGPAYAFLLIEKAIFDRHPWSFGLEHPSYETRIEFMMECITSASSLGFSPSVAREPGLVSPKMMDRDDWVDVLGAAHGLFLSLKRERDDGTESELQADELADAVASFKESKKRIPDLAREICACDVSNFKQEQWVRQTEMHAAALLRREPLAEGVPVGSKVVEGMRSGSDPAVTLAGIGSRQLDAPLICTAGWIASYGLAFWSRLWCAGEEPYTTRVTVLRDRLRHLNFLVQWSLEIASVQRKFHGLLGKELPPLTENSGAVAPAGPT